LGDDNAIQGITLPVFINLEDVLARTGRGVINNLEWSNHFAIFGFPRLPNEEAPFVALHKLIRAVRKIVQSSFLITNAGIRAIHVLRASDKFIAPEVVIVGNISPKYVIHSPAVLPYAESSALVVVRQVIGDIILVGADIYSA
jgi:hypothetical protein